MIISEFFFYLYIQYLKYIDRLLRKYTLGNDLDRRKLKVISQNDTYRNLTVIDRGSLH